MLCVCWFGLLIIRCLRASSGRELGLALRQLSMTEQRFRAVLAVQAGGRVGEIAAQFGVSRQSVSA
jgi:Helix-turn-helix domain